MRDRIERILKIASLALGALVLTQVVLAIVRSNPVAKLSIPAVPTLSTNTNSTAEANGTNAPAVKTAAKNGTNVQNGASASAKTGTTNAAPAEAKTTGTNSNAMATAVGAGTNNVVLPEAEKPATNAVAQPEPKAGTNQIATSSEPAEAGVTNAPASQGTNTVAQPKPDKGTNAIAMQEAASAGTNTPSGTNKISKISSKKSPGSDRPAMMAMAGMPGMGGGGKPSPELSAATKTRIDRIYESELLGQIMRPVPMGLLGIAGNTAFLRSPSGQTGLVKEGDSLGELKLVRIGINRVLVEKDGKQEELMIFNGYGGESLLTK